MAVQAVTVRLSGPLYERLARRAQRARRTVEAELADAVATFPDEPDEPPADMAQASDAVPLSSTSEDEATADALCARIAGKLENLARAASKDDEVEIHAIGVSARYDLRDL